MSSSFDICIRGSGVVASTLALLLARQRLKIALVGQSPVSDDVRAYALNARSRELLSELRCWPDELLATPVQSIQVWGDAGGQVQFQAPSFLGLTHIVDVPKLESLLADAITFQPTIQRVTSAVEARLTVVCEGRHSATRQALGVDYNTLPYAQTALATRVRCATPHRAQALQWFAQSQGELDILALLPLGGPNGDEAAVVWSMSSSKAHELQQLSIDKLSHAITQASHETLGAVQVCSAVKAWPLQLARAEHWSGEFDTDHAWVLAGDAAHSIHPLAGLGLNLGLADASELATVLQEREATAYWRSVGDRYLLRKYERSRKAGLLATWLACDGLQRLFNHPHAAVQTLRNWGLNSFNQSSLLKRWTIDQAMH